MHRRNIRLHPCDSDFLYGTWTTCFERLTHVLQFQLDMTFFLFTADHLAERPYQCCFLSSFRLGSKKRNFFFLIHLHFFNTKNTSTLQLQKNTHTTNIPVASFSRTSAAAFVFFSLSLGDLSLKREE